MMMVMMMIMMMMMMMMMLMISSTLVDDAPCKYPGPAQSLILEIHTVFGMVGKGHSGRRRLQLG